MPSDTYARFAVEATSPGKSRHALHENHEQMLGRLSIRTRYARRESARLPCLSAPSLTAWLRALREETLLSPRLDAIPCDASTSACSAKKVSNYRSTSAQDMDSSHMDAWPPGKSVMVHT
ncbi:hypothetical protein C8Q76DRAFT_716883 [Earliella scabrosa]|nr:hypothetical protein C8Q76DRAFT_716883 [Earliella scabrosa]